jgi:hypothetical protein
MHRPGYVQGGQEAKRGYLLLGIYHRRIPGDTVRYLLYSTYQSGLLCHAEQGGLLLGVGIGGLGDMHLFSAQKSLRFQYTEAQGFLWIWNYRLFWKLYSKFRE